MGDWETHLGDIRKKKTNFAKCNLKKITKQDIETLGNVASDYASFYNVNRREHDTIHRALENLEQKKPLTPKQKYFVRDIHKYSQDDYVYDCEK